MHAAWAQLVKLGGGCAHAAVAANNHNWGEQFGVV
jgi:hypothetical protein